MNRIFVFPGEMTSLNDYISVERTNRFMAASVKKAETEGIALLARNAAPIPDDAYPVSVYFKWYVKDRRKDPDNIAYAKKFILDGLQDAGIITNDSFKCISHFSDDFFVDKLEPRVEVEIVW